MKKIIKKTEGITVVALVVTIVVLLILAGATMNFAVNGTGIFNKAKLAGREYENASENESEELKEVSKKIDKATRGSISDGSWNSNKNVNSPKIDSTGLIPVIMNSDGSITEVNNGSEDWYDYNTTENGSRWANAVTEDSNKNITGYFVWIPRYEYKIVNKTIEIKFIETSKTTADDGYIIQPAFTTNINNGGWDSEIPGIWVAKYPAGYQANTFDQTTWEIGNSTDTVVRSATLTYKYTANDKSVVDDKLAVGTSISYPVFKPLTLAYGNLCVGDCYNIAQEMKEAKDFYGLDANYIDSHLSKNSEWGAVAYLAYSNYGRNGKEVYKNNFTNGNRSQKNDYAITGLYTDKANVGTATNSSFSSAHTYNSNIGVNGSTTGNITGVYDLNGCVWERQATYAYNGADELIQNGFSFISQKLAIYNPAKGNYSTKYATAIPKNKDVYSQTVSKDFGFGDAMNEISNITANTNTAWNGEQAAYPYDKWPFVGRGGSYYTANTGMLYYQATSGGCYHADGYRVVLI